MAAGLTAEQLRTIDGAYGAGPAWLAAAVDIGVLRSAMHSAVASSERALLSRLAPLTILARLHMDPACRHRMRRRRRDFPRVPQWHPGGPGCGHGQHSAWRRRADCAAGQPAARPHPSWQHGRGGVHTARQPLAVDRGHARVPGGQQPTGCSACGHHIHHQVCLVHRRWAGQRGARMAELSARCSSACACITPCTCLLAPGLRPPTVMHPMPVRTLPLSCSLRLPG